MKLLNNNKKKSINKIIWKITSYIKIILKIEDNINKAQDNNNRWNKITNNNYLNNISKLFQF